METGGLNKINNLQQRWSLFSALSDGLLSTAAALSASALTHLIGMPVWPVLIFVFVLAMYLLGQAHRFWKWQPVDVAFYLNRRFPELQESAQLLLKPAESRNGLEHLQAQRVETSLQHQPIPLLPDRRMLYGILAAGVALLLWFGAAALNKGQLFAVVRTGAGSTAVASPKPERRPAVISDVQVTITAPPYTGLPVKSQSAFNIQATEGSMATWEITTSMPVDTLSLLFNDKETLLFQPVGKDRTAWTVRRNLTNPGFYQVVINGVHSDMYGIDLVKDLPPVVRILTPAQYTTLDLGARKQVPLKVSISDDFGISTSWITATIASGSGEAVRFREQRIPFSSFAPGRETDAQKLLNLDQLGMKPGDELYYYVSATDNHRQENRSDIYIITLPDTTELMEIEGMANSVNLKLEYFRSQRQIIIETEQLIKDRDTLTPTAFNTKSNNLGMDQKMLRLRYGKFLGEETDNEVGGHHDEHGDRPERVFGDPTDIIEEFTHKHDNAEDATFFDPKQKAQLKATLSEMWNAELQLRLYKPQDALVYEYKALRLLKDLQQQSRSYVAKASYKTTPLRPEKRLTADLSKITQPVAVEKTNDPGSASLPLLQQAAGLLEDLSVHQPVTDDGRRILQAAARELGLEAARKPTVYLGSFEAMKRVLTGLSKSPGLLAFQDIRASEKGLQGLIRSLPQAPPPGRSGIRQQLSQQYFNNLHSNR